MGLWPTTLPQTWLTTWEKHPALLRMEAASFLLFAHLGRPFSEKASPRLEVNTTGSRGTGAWPPARSSSAGLRHHSLPVARVPLCLSWEPPHTHRLSLEHACGPFWGWRLHSSGLEAAPLRTHEPLGGSWEARAVAPRPQFAPKRPAHPRTPLPGRITAPASFHLRQPRATPRPGPH